MKDMKAFPGSMPVFTAVCSLTENMEAGPGRREHRWERAKAKEAVALN